MSAPGPGPPYPRYAPGNAPGQNAIGEFIIGQSPVGTIIPFDYWSTIISQYGNSTVITTLVGYFNAWLDQTQNLDAFYDDIWNIATAQSYGLDVWGRIVGVIRTVNLVSQEYFGFYEQSPTVQDFGVGGSGLIYTAFAGTGPLYNGEGLNTTSYAMTDSQFRQLIIAKAMFNITTGSAQSINAILRFLFPNNLGNAYVADNGSMAITYVFTFPLTPLQLSIITQSNVLPAPTGVRVMYSLTAGPNFVALQARAKGPAIKARATLSHSP